MKFQDIQITKFGNFFFESYFKSLQAYSRKINPTRQIEIGEVVLFKDDKFHGRGAFPIGIVTGYGNSNRNKKNDYQRVLKIRIRKAGKNIEIVRPYHDFALLEITDDSESN